MVLDCSGLPRPWADDCFAVGLCAALWPCEWTPLNFAGCGVDVTFGLSDGCYVRGNVLLIKDDKVFEIK